MEKWGKYHFPEVKGSDITSRSSGIYLLGSENKIGKFRCSVKFYEFKKNF